MAGFSALKMTVLPGVAPLDFGVKTVGADFAALAGVSTCALADCTLDWTSKDPFWIISVVCFVTTGLSVTAASLLNVVLEVTLEWGVSSEESSSHMCFRPFVSLAKVQSPSSLSRSASVKEDGIQSDCDAAFCCVASMSFPSSGSSGVATERSDCNVMAVGERGGGGLLTFCASSSSTASGDPALIFLFLRFAFRLSGASGAIASESTLSFPSVVRDSGMGTCLVAIISSSKRACRCLWGDRSRTEDMTGKSSSVSELDGD